MQNYSFVFDLPVIKPNHDPSWFGFPITVKESAPFTRNEFVEFLERNGISTRLVFAGNLTKQPAFKSENYRIVGDLKNTDLVMKNTFFIEVYPGINEQKLVYMKEIITSFLRLKGVK